MAISNVTLFSIAIRFQFGNERFLIALFCTFPVSRDRYPRYWSQDTIKLASLECLVNRLQRTEVLECHTGCVNTVRWNHNGTKIVSGSDDCHLGIWNIHFHHDVESKLISRFETGHQANIFHALFVPHTDDDEIISAALDCDVRYNIISREQSQRIGTHNGPCHKLDIITPKVFISCSEDGTIKLMDLRDKSTINTTRSAAAVQNTFIRLFKFKHITTPRSTTNNPQIKNGTNPQNHHNQGPSSCSPKSEISISGSALPKITTEKVSCYTACLNPMDNHIVAAGCRDKWVRLYDRRMCTIGDGRHAKPYMLFTQHSLLHKKTVWLQSPRFFFSFRSVHLLHHEINRQHPNDVILAHRVVASETVPIHC